MTSKLFTIISEVGLHARPATLLVQEASRYSSEVELQYNDKKVNVKSIMGVMSLGIPQGGKFNLIITGSDEDEAFEGIKQLLAKEGIAEEVEQ